MTRHLLIGLAAFAGLSMGNFTRAGDDVFPILAWGPTPESPEILKRMKACGVTIAGFATPGQLDRCEAAGLKAIVHDPRASGYTWTSVDPAAARPRLAELVAQVGKHPACHGYMLSDEPSAAAFPGLEVVSGLIRELHPGAWPYINLLPNYASVDQWGTPTYEEYLEKFVATVHPTALSYDHYALYEGGGFGDRYFANLETMRKVAQAHDLPFWNIVLASGLLNYRVPTESDFRFQVFTSLAYGARGIAYFTYVSVPTGNFRNSAVDQFGHETETYGRMRSVNLQVERLGPTLMQLHSDRVYHFGGVPAGGSGPDEHSLVETIAGPMLVGDFTHHDGSRYVLIVNRDFAASSPCLPQLRKPWTKLEVVSPYTDRLLPYEGEERWLAPGQGSLLKLSK